MSDKHYFFDRRCFGEGGGLRERCIGRVLKWKAEAMPSNQSAVSSTLFTVGSGLLDMPMRSVWPRFSTCWCFPSKVTQESALARIKNKQARKRAERKWRHMSCEMEEE